MGALARSVNLVVSEWVDESAGDAKRTQYAFLRWLKLIQPKVAFNGVHRRVDLKKRHELFSHEGCDTIWLNDGNGIAGRFNLKRE